MKNQEQWAMPLDEFIVYSPELGNYAEQLLIGRCLQEAGRSWPVPWQNTDFPTRKDQNRVGNRIFNEFTAATWGYHYAPNADEVSVQLWWEFGDATDPAVADPAFMRDFDACSDKVRSTDISLNWLRDVDSWNYVNGLASQAADIVEQDDEVRRAVARWRECLSAQIDFAVPEDDRQMPTQEVSQRFGLTGPEASMTASAEEIAVAVADAECRTSSGLAELRYDREWEEQQKLLDANRDQLERIRAEAKAHHRVLLESIAANAPGAP
ncbi:hypothetical protein K8F61_16625 [Microbacterium resistens]|uniref:Uncharacterized protein n=1 Tax=Microbacterium resistens TaxID=156977 RepID=A0ABY3RR21_9MICO|nr:hypothetical protein [Microbacterium resistens]UGS26232.1 hypothetical protein K8F61_16625 [Microbacterium resistens]